MTFYNCLRRAFMQKFALLLVICFLLCSCSQGQKKTFETETESTTISETVVETSSESSAETYTTSITTEIEIATETTAETDIEYSEYVYNPPQEVLDTHFYSDDIEAEISFIWIGHDPGKLWYEESPYTANMTDEEYTDILHNEFKETLPDEIVDDMLLYASETEWSKNCAVVGMGYMLYDMNNDGHEDYITAESISSDGYTAAYLYKIYISYGNGSYKSIKWSCFKEYNAPHILKSQTNDLKDIMILHNSNYPIITYNSDDSYTPRDILDEKHTFWGYDTYSDNLIKVGMYISVIDAPIGEYYTAIKLADNPYLKNNMLYTCYPDGTPRSYIEKPFGESLPTDFSPTQDGYYFYGELNDEYTQNDLDPEFFWSGLDLLEIKYIAVNGDNNH